MAEESYGGSGWLISVRSYRTLSAESGKRPAIPDKGGSVNRIGGTGETEGPGGASVGIAGEPPPGESEANDDKRGHAQKDVLPAPPIRQESSDKGTDGESGGGDGEVHPEDLSPLRTVEDRRQDGNRIFFMSIWTSDRLFSIFLR